MTFEIVEPPSFPYFDHKHYSFSLVVKKGNYIFTSGHSASEFDHSLKKMICKGDLAEQTRTAHEKLRLILEAAAANFRDVAKVVDYLAPGAAGHEQVIDQIRREFFKDSLPAQSRLYVDQLVRPDALIEIAFTALTGTSKKLEVGASIGQPYPSAVRKGNTVFVSGSTAIQSSTGKVPVKADLEDQARTVYENLRIILERLGTNLSDVVKVNEQLRPQEPSDYNDLSMVRRRAFPGSFPAVTQIVTERLSHPEALIEVDCVAIAGAGEKTTINPGWRTYLDDGRSPAVLKNGLIFMSGALPIDHEKGKLVGEGDVVAQIKQVFSNIDRVLDAAGAGFQDIAKTEDHIVPGALANYRATADIRKELFKNRFPASSGVVVHNLTHRGALIQVDCTATVD